MRALICRPGTTLVIGVRLAALGAIVARSVCGVNANAGRPAIELLAGVVSGLLVVRSALSTQVTSASSLPMLLQDLVAARCGAGGHGEEQRKRCGD